MTKSNTAMTPKDLEGLKARLRDKLWTSCHDMERDEMGTESQFMRMA